MIPEEMIKGTSEFTETFLKFIFLLHDISNENDKRYYSYGVSREKFHTLFFLYTSSEPLGPSEIANKINVTRASMTGHVDSLEKEHLLERVNHPQDRRKVILKLTKNGKNLVEKIMPPHYEWVCKVNEAFTQEEREYFTSYLLKMRYATAELTQIIEKDLNAG
ncbi:DNA-binding transcriptional regulator, MarR family [Paenibacillus sp. yr247]|uniref:MarR family winged helix-turn-helix transcriptional regulator n=1 Tax=Paenibacillus sp. yr247 TaxID=1761880 RepID=UPI000889FAF4|nr:MarR family transcriptional regulator [Paenibacillus sp. yr247]SDN93778.1 DNA-binding transcriptional regulator, MarR family [Paenibacillus sp. yr247]